MASLGLLRAGVIGPLIEDLRSHGTNVTPLLSKAKLPLVIAERQEGLIPWAAALKFLPIVARYTGDPLFAANCILSAGGKRPNRVASVSLDRTTTKFEAIRTFVMRTNAITTGATITSTISDDWMWILRRPNNPGDIDSWHAEQFVIATFVKAISSYLGDGWWPQKLKIRRATRPDNIPSQWSEADIETANPHTAIGVKLVDIVSGTKCDHEHTSLPGNWEQAELREAVVNDRASLRSAVLHYIEHEAERIARVADAFGVTERTFRRHLKTAGLSYSELVNETRYRRSLVLLKDSSLSITELALILRYRYPENFTRAFRKRVGVSPSEYRKMSASD
jgi:AraC-like DNA-binding protein